jgi:hypothetical protein
MHFSHGQISSFIARLPNLNISDDLLIYYLSYVPYACNLVAQIQTLTGWMISKQDKFNQRICSK